MLAVLVLAAAAGYQLRAPVTPSGVRRSRPACMGGFEQKGLPLAPGERVSLQLNGPAETLKHLTALCRESARSSSVTGIIYDIERLNRLELIAEGARESLDELVKLAESAQGVEVLKMAWQAPVGGYSTDFAVVTLKPKMAASLDVKGDKQCLDYYTRHLKVEAVFNRGLQVESSRPNDDLLKVVVTGDAGRLKSFVRWAQRGPPLQRADGVDVSWSPTRT